MENKMPKIIDCQAINCVYNINKKCHTPAITVGDDEPCCDTFYTSRNKGGFTDVNGGVGACKVTECEYNDSFECSASGIHVAIKKDHADCVTFKQKK